MKLEGRVAIVTGAASGMGRATAQLFADEGARVVVADLHAAAAEETVKQIESALPGSATAVTADVRRAADCQRMIDTALERFGRLDVLININCICPGAVLTPLLGEAINIDDPAQIAAIGRGSALGRVGQPDEVARVSLFLCCDDASYMTGATLSVDGGPPGASRLGG